ncbi:S41 family peptidase [uncultured Bacteroides sp.]|uniref:S41 family peptidase n=1 Tax=uncultured Bacteroides sp. TaxID=162156 RepID=UPI002AAAE765|nr:S41 family peptidase [uncultured Bacteroides sp.]
MKNFLTKKIAILAGVVLLGLSFSSFKDDDRNIKAAKNLDIFNAIYKELDMFYVDTINPDKSIRTGIDAMLEALDPYTEYYAEEDMGDLNLMIKGSYGGIGSVITYYKGKVAIDEPYEGMPAAKAGLKAGDVLVEIDGKDLKGKSVAQVSELLKGQIGTSFLLKVERPGTKKPLEFKLTRESIQIPAVPYYSVEANNTGYIQLSSFTGKPAKEFKDAFLALKKKGITSLVIDLRNNGGGLLDEAVEIANMFLPRGTEIVATRGKMKQGDRIYKTAHEPIDPNIPITVLVNSSSASASEILSGAFQDLDRAVIMGTRTYGKGLVQTTRNLPYGCSLKLTTAKYYIPSGRCVQAIDYKHRNEDGSVGRVPDSLTTVFHTAAGREVRDGGGITPDMEIKAEKTPNILYYLLVDKLIFEYANNYCLKHTTIPAAKDFVLTDEDYKEFKAMVNKSDFKYDRQSDKVLKNLKEVAEFEGYMDDASEEFKALEKKLSHNQDRDLDHFSKDIKSLISAEIVKRYQYQKGAITQQLKNDDGLVKAIELLNNPEKYKSILSTVKASSPHTASAQAK